MTIAAQPTRHAQPLIDDAHRRATVNAIAARFIQRIEPYAVQYSGGGYTPARDKSFNRSALEKHVSGAHTLGHYLLDSNSRTKIFALDIDLNTTDKNDPNSVAGWLPTMVLPVAASDEDIQSWHNSFVPVHNLQAAWHDRSNAAARQYIKSQMRELVAVFTSHIWNYLNIPTAAVYSGNKGIHVYGFLGKDTPAQTARECAEMMIAVPGWFGPYRGNNFYRDMRGSAENTAQPDLFTNWTIELFPKQVQLGPDGLGNLMRVPLGKNLHHPADPTFFIDLNAPLNALRPVDPIHALGDGNPWRDQ